MTRQHEHGSKTALSEEYEISRPTVHAAAETVQSVLRTPFETALLGGAGVDVQVDDAQLRRAVVALRVVAPNAIRPVEDLLPVLYPGVKVSYGTIQQMLVEAEGRAARFNARSSLACRRESTFGPSSRERGPLARMDNRGPSARCGQDARAPRTSRFVTPDPFHVVGWSAGP